MAKTKRTIGEIKDESEGGDVEYSDEEAPKSKKSKKEKANTASKSSTAEDEFWSVSCHAISCNYSMESNQCYSSQLAVETQNASTSLNLKR